MKHLTNKMAWSRCNNSLFTQFISIAEFHPKLSSILEEWSSFGIFRVNEENGKSLAHSLRSNR